MQILRAQLIHNKAIVEILSISVVLLLRQVDWSG